MSLVTAFIKYIGIFPIGSAVLLSNGAKAVVIDINRVNPMQPKVRVWYDETGKRLEVGLDISLQDNDLTVAETINPLVGNTDPYNLLFLDAQ